eukprot:CAMPEP_0113859014 /NCGR_PEP_ID=MMETSP0372-20130328/11821_1 /TAXON_ID=340204 /ORGANISM="Lankesteria abbotti" /LENGTH=122 /DNA_ID=CAMNT_0000836609 /DNA_START=18 /DNA_END=383 /DNA_ORIENTATION=+ /assembly_acc=CAM_ASM_000359
MTGKKHSFSSSYDAFPTTSKHWRDIRVIANGLNCHYERNLKDLKHLEKFSEARRNHLIENLEVMDALLEKLQNEHDAHLVNWRADMQAHSRDSYDFSTPQPNVGEELNRGWLMSQTLHHALE